MTKFKNIMLAATLGTAMIAGGGIALAQSDKNYSKSKALSEQHCPAVCTQACAPDSCVPGRGAKNCTRRGGKPGSPMVRAMEGIDLTQAQKDSVKSIVQRQRQAVREGERKLRQEARANTDKQLQQVLTPEQFAKYQANREQQKELRKNRGQRDGKAFGNKKGRHGHHTYTGKDRKGDGHAMRTKK